MHRLDQKPVVWNYLRLLMQRAAIYSVQGVAVTAPPAPAPSPSARPRVNVYLCIKQALFIRPMNMHCLVAVARCRVQTRRYHCLINHIQSHRLTLCRLPLLAAPFSPCSTRFSPFSALAAPHAERTRRVIPQNFPRAFSLVVLSRSLLSSLPPPQSTLPLFPSRQPAAIDINLRNFFGASTCHRVTVHPRPDVPDAGAEYAGMRLAGVTGEGERAEGGE